MNLHNIVIVLAHPEESRNIGAVCRAMANNGLRCLRIVGSRADYDDEHVRRLAIHAAPLWEAAQFYGSVAAATADCTLSAGTTRRRGKKRKGKLLLPEEFAELAARITGAGEAASAPQADSAATPAGAPAANNGASTAGAAASRADGTERAPAADSGSAPRPCPPCAGGAAPAPSAGGKVAVVFGNERTGLMDDELEACTMGVTIPAAAEFASLNLSHAVQIIAYQLFREQAQVSAGSVPVTLARLDAAVARIADSLQRIGFFSVAGRADMERFWRMILSRAAVSEGEARYIEKVFDKAAGLSGKNRAASPG